MAKRAKKRTDKRPYCQRCGCREVEQLVEVWVAWNSAGDEIVAGDSECMSGPGDTWCPRCEDHSPIVWSASEVDATPE